MGVPPLLLLFLVPVVGIRALAGPHDGPDLTLDTVHGDAPRELLVVSAGACRFSQKQPTVEHAIHLPEVHRMAANLDKSRGRWRSASRRRSGSMRRRPSQVLFRNDERRPPDGGR